MRLPKVIRHAGASLAGRIPVRIRSGPNAGLQWTAVSAGRGVRAGTFERERVGAIVSMLRLGDCVWDIGAHKGYIALAAARRVGAGGHVYAFEPAPPNLEFLRRHVEWNRADNITIMPNAVSVVDGTSRFGGPGSSVTYRLGQGDYEVQMRSVDSLLRSGVRAPNVLKIDVEGHESEVLRGAAGRLQDDCLVFVAIHSLEQYHACVALIESMGWRVIPSRAVSRLLEHDPVVWRADPDIIGIGPERMIDNAAIAAFQ
jgi:FkbM family methyltransferase